MISNATVADDIATPTLSTHPCRELSRVSHERAEFELYYDI
jgi:hypothetical protein